MKQTKLPKLPEWAQFIAGKALAEIKTAKDIGRIREKVSVTALGFYLKEFDNLIAHKQKAGLIK